MEYCVVIYAKIQESRAFFCITGCPRASDTLYSSKNRTTLTTFPNKFCVNGNYILLDMQVSL